MVMWTVHMNRDGTVLRPLDGERMVSTNGSGTTDICMQKKDGHQPHTILKSGLRMDLRLKCKS